MRLLTILMMFFVLSGCAVTTIEQAVFETDINADVDVPFEKKLVVMADDSESQRYVLKTIATLNQQGFKYVYTEQGVLATKIEPDMSVILRFTKNGGRTGSAITPRSTSSSGGATKSGYVSPATGGGNRSSSLGPSGPAVVRNKSLFAAQWYDIKNDKIIMENRVTASTPLPCDDQKVNTFLAEQFFMKFQFGESTKTRYKVNYDCGSAN